uniref:RNA cytidine acetyltransferase n=1 Tax=Cyprinus carpio TaxID=7962 RepID=A0A8C1T241_CYPCA
MLSKATVRARPSVLWCYKKELSFSSNRKKRMRQLQKKIKTGTLNLNQDDPFELFVAATNIRYCYYNETHKILGNTYGMCVLQDFEALTPNLLARTVETVEGGGIVVILLRTMNSLKQLYTMAMDVHSRYRTEAHQDVVGRFNERFILSLSSCKTCVVIDDQLNILPISTHITNIKPVPPKTQDDGLSPREQELKDLKESLQDTQPVGVLVDSCKTMDQTKAVLKFIEAISEKTLRSTVALTAARGRGKSAALGLAVAGAVTFGYSNIFVTSPSPDNLHTLFEFVFKGFDALQYQVIITGHKARYDVFTTGLSYLKSVISTQRVKPSVISVETLIVPLLFCKLLILVSPCRYEGTGRSLSLKLIQQLRQQSADSQLNLSAENRNTSTARLAAARTLHEVTLHESIRYGQGDPVEKWLNDLLCLDCLSVPRIISGCPLPQTCDLYYVNRDTLFCYHKASEAFLQRLMALYVASHYKNSPNDLQMLSDAPAHHLFCLLPPVPPTQSSLPEVLAVVQVCLEGEISRQSVLNSLSRGKKASGDLIPWTLSEQFQDPEFGSLSGGRIVRIAVNPDYQGMGYGSRSLQLLQHYYEGQFPLLDETSPQLFIHVQAVSLLEEVVSPRKDLPPLLLKLNERRAERLDYLGVSYGLTPQLLKFWKKAGFVPVYLRQTPNDLTGEHSCIMLKELNAEESTEQNQWLSAFWKDFRRRFLSLLSFQFSKFSPTLALNILQNKNAKDDSPAGTELAATFTPYDLKRLEMYSRNMVDYHLIMDMIPVIAHMYFLKQLGDITLSVAQCNDAAKEFQEKQKKDMEKIKDMNLSEYMIRGDDEEWDQVLKKAGHTAIVSIKSDKKRKLEGMNQKEQWQSKKMKKNKDKKSKFGKNP